MNLTKWLLPIAFAVLQSVCASVAVAADLRIEIDHAPAAATQMYVALFDSPQAFAANKPTDTKVVDIKGRPTTVTFSGLVEGAYALTVFADENANGKLDTNLVGMPTEKYGFSNNAMGFMGPPKFNAAAVQMTGDDKKISIALH